MQGHSAHCESNEPLSTEVALISLKELSERKEDQGHPHPSQPQLELWPRVTKLADRRQSCLKWAPLVLDCVSACAAVCLFALSLHVCIFHSFHLFPLPSISGLSICGHNCLLTAEWMSASKIVCRVGPAKDDKGEIIVTTKSGGLGTSTVSFKLIRPERIGKIEISPSCHLLCASLDKRSWCKFKQGLQLMIIYISLALNSLYSLCFSSCI